ncbi:MAG: FAD-dependent oxidoreductase, partial [Acidobacteriota bacterium]
MKATDPKPDLLVIGAGITGLSAACELADLGMRVEVVEATPAPEPETCATLAAAGMLAPLAETPTPGPFFDACRQARDAWAPFAARLTVETGLDLDYDTRGALMIDPLETYLEDMETAAQRLGEPTERIDHATLVSFVPDVADRIDGALHLPAEHRVDNQRVHQALRLAAKRRGIAIHYEHRVHRIDDARVEGDGWRRDA